MCSVRFRSVCIGMANRNRIFQFVKFSTETDRNGWKTIGFGVYWFQSVSVGFRFSKERVIEIFKTLNLITYKKQSNRAIERELTTEKEKFPTIFVQQFTVLHTDSNKKLKIFWISKRVQTELYRCCTIAGAYHHAWAYHHVSVVIFQPELKKEQRHVT